MSNLSPIAAVLGDPISHSKSPKLFRHWLDALALEGTYLPLHVSQENFETVLRSLPLMGFAGVNVTLPHKERALKLADMASDRATLIGAANTLTFTHDGGIRADNTDGYGFLANLKQGAPSWDAKQGPALVLGAGGAARAVVASLLEAGVERILISNRTRGRAEILQSMFGSRLEVVNWVDAGDAVDDAHTIINTTSLGMVNQPELRIPLDGLTDAKVVTDLVYAPLETRLLKEARAAGCAAVDGLGMLLHQAVPGFERWFGVRPEVTHDTRLAVLG